MIFENHLTRHTKEAIEKLFNVAVDSTQIAFQQTRKEFEGDITLVVFSFTKITKKSPEETGKLIGEYLQQHSGIVSIFNCVKGFLNLVIENKEWLALFSAAVSNPDFGFVKADANEQPVLVEYSSPNTNKPLHLGHVRNNLIGWSVAALLKAAGQKVIKTNIVNDRGIHICKSMLAWQKFGSGETPVSSGIKGDHLVGKYYVEFDKHLKEEKAATAGSKQSAEGNETEVDENQLPLMIEAKEMLLKWEQGDKQVMDVWKMMNGWVYDGFAVTYKNLGVDFDKVYYESQTYILGKKIVEEGLQKNVFYKKDDGSVWLDLREEGLDEKVMQRSNGTALYITQDLGTAIMRHSEFDFKQMVFVVANEQDYHFKVLFKALKKLGYAWADNCYHLNYAMVDLPSGKMKSREGTVVDADELMQEVIDAAKEETHKLGKIDEFSQDELQQLYRTLGMGALKYFILKVDPEKRMLFNPSESVEIHGNTGPYIQYVHARICSVLHAAKQNSNLADFETINISAASLNDKEKELLKHVLYFEETVQAAAGKLSPALVANYVYDLAKVFNQFYHENTIIDTEQTEASKLRLLLSKACADIIRKSLALLGIDSPVRM